MITRPGVAPIAVAAVAACHGVQALPVHSGLARLRRPAAQTETPPAPESFALGPGDPIPQVWVEAGATAMKPKVIRALEATVGGRSASGAASVSTTIPTALTAVSWSAATKGPMCPPLAWQWSTAKPGSDPPGRR